MKWTFIVGGVIAILWISLHLWGDYLGAVRIRHTPLEQGNIDVPQKRTFEWLNQSALTDELLQDFASRKLPERNFGSVHRILLAKFAARKDLDAANAYMKRLEPWANTGSTWPLHTEGNYDFSLLGFTAILHLFGDQPDVLYPDTRENLLNVVLTEEGGEVKESVPRTLGFIKDTENHLLMGEGARYLKNRWLAQHGSTNPKHDNVKNGLEAWLLDNLKELETEGFYEFNSVPYIGYTLSALMNLEAFASPKVQASARLILDRANWEYAVGSLNLRRFAPFRRQMRRAGGTALNRDYHTAMMNIWMSLKADASLAFLEPNGNGHALWPVLLPYRLPDQTALWMGEKPKPYFVKVGHGPGASPEIYSGGPGYLITAGGVHRGNQSMIVARPITLMVEDGAKDLKQLIHLAGPGDDFKGWNNTGVYRDFACAAGSVQIPEGWSSVASNGLWAVYAVAGGMHVAVHSQENLGVLCLFHEGESQDILEAVANANSDAEVLRESFQWPNGERLTYDVLAPKDRWVMIRAGDVVLDRKFDMWPMMEGDL